MTVEWLRTYEGFENYSEEEAKKALDTVRSLAHILMGMYNCTPTENFNDHEKS